MQKRFMADVAVSVASVLWAFLGGAAYTLFWKEYGKDKWGDTIRHLLLSLIAGALYGLEIAQGFPDSTVSFVMGWFAPDVIQGIVNRARPPTPIPSPTP